MMDYFTQITTNFSMNEFFRSEEDFISSSDGVKANIVLVSAKLQLFRDYKRTPIIINSGYRSKLYNAAIGGRQRSYHLDGLASDIIYNGISNTWRQDFEELKKHFKGVIYYPKLLFFHCDLGHRNDRPYHFLNGR